MQLITFHNWQLAIDSKTTAAFYSRDLEQCHCDDCDRYGVMMQHRSNPFHPLFQQLGIDPLKPANLSYFDDPTEPFYIADYHFVGRMVDGALCTDSHFTTENTMQLSNVTIGFSEELTMLEDDFPSPVLQLTVVVAVPKTVRIQEISSPFITLIDGKNCSTTNKLFREFAEKFSFPNYFGKNWAAFNECLNDLEWLEADEYVLIITNFEHLLAKKPNERDIFLEILKSTMYQWTFQMGTSFQVIVRHKK